MEIIKVLLVDDQSILLDGLKAILETDENIQVIGLAKDGEEAIEFIKSQLPDVVLMDIRMPKMNGVECTRKIKSRWNNIAIIMLTTFDDEEYVIEALNVGANGYLLKDISGQGLIQSVKDAYSGDTILPSKIATRIVSRLINPTENRKEKLKKKLNLTEREAELAIMLSDGFTNKQIASALFLTVGTTKNYISSIYRKLDIEERTAAVIKIRKLLEEI